MLVGDVGINLSGRDVGVTKHALDGAEIGAIHKKIGSKAMAKGMRGNVLCNAGFTSIFLNNTFNRAGGEATIVTRSVGRSEIFTVVEKEWS